MAHDSFAKGRVNFDNRFRIQGLSRSLIRICQHSHQRLMFGPVRVLTEKHINVGFGKSSSGCLVGVMAYNQFTTRSSPKEPPIAVRAGIQVPYMMSLVHSHSPIRSEMGGALLAVTSAHTWRIKRNRPLEVFLLKEGELLVGGMFDRGNPIRSPFHG